MVNMNFKNFLASMPRLAKIAIGVGSLLGAWKCTQIALAFLTLTHGGAPPAPGAVVHHVYYWNGVKIENWGLVAIPCAGLVIALLLGSLGIYLLLFRPLHQTKTRPGKSS
ncbi:MAG: hypothetical protein JWN25_125 [Verrucomicrobiales bacterium]|nr:hypothetical protein [Verrucomicrobiales bacterium]